MKTKIPFSNLLTISSDEEGQRIDNFLRTWFKEKPKSMIYRVLRKGEVRVNKKRTKPKYKLITNDEVRIPPMWLAKNKKKKDLSHSMTMTSLDKTILYEDDFILVLNKPSGIAVHGGSGLCFGIIEELRAVRLDLDTRFLQLAHRLDRDASGVLVIVKKRSALRSLHEQLREKRIQKEYLILVRGQWKANIKTIRVPLLKNVLQQGERIVRVSQKGKPSETRFKVEERYKLATLVRCIPITGRTHQIRVHTQYAGNPIAFDSRYGDRNFDRCLLHTGLKRLFLHAVSLKFTHPNTGEIISISAPLDKQLKRCLKILRS